MGQKSCLIKPLGLILISTASIICWNEIEMRTPLYRALYGTQIERRMVRLESS
jgi:hypothetical protein